MEPYRLILLGDSCSGVPHHVHEQNFRALRQALLKRAPDAGLANARLAREQNDASPLTADLLPAAQIGGEGGVPDRLALAC